MRRSPRTPSEEGDGDAAPSDYSSCDDSENERYSSANSILDSARSSSFGSCRYSSANSFLDSSRSSSFGSRGEFLDSLRGLSFREDARGRDLFGGEGNPEAPGEGDGGSPVGDGFYEDGVLRGRLDALPRIRTRPDRGDPFSGAANLANSSACTSGGRNPDVGFGSGEVDGLQNSLQERILGRSSSGGATALSTCLGPFDVSIPADADQEDAIDVSSSGRNAMIGKVEMFSSSGCLSSPASISRESSDFMDASATSPVYGTSSSIQQSARIDRIEVVGARHKKGDVSFGERLIGVKEYGVYTLAVQSGENQWQVERRYHDFFLLYCQLKVQFADHGLRLPPPWSKVPKESRKIFGNASTKVIKKRSVLIQNCFQSILSVKTPFETPSCLIWFLFPINAFCDPNISIDLLSESSQKLRNEGSQESLALANMVSQMMEVRAHRTKKELLEEQGDACAGCHRYLSSKMSPLEELIQILGWGKFQVCEFTGQLFCSSCHKNETAVLPARVLLHWDFTLYPVCNTAKKYLDSMYNQPILCVSAVNPFLFLKFSSLLNVVDMRKKIGTMIPYIRCPFRRSIDMYFGSRKYLLEANDFFSLRDLVDLSKGAFAELPALLNNLLHKIREHLVKQCPVCYELGIPCAAQNACREPSLLMFPLQETGAIGCASCGLIYHDVCFRYLAVCQCGKTNSVSRVVGSLGPRNPGEEIELDGVVDSPTRNFYGQSSGYISELISKARPEFQWIPRNNRVSVTMNSLLDSFS